MQKIDKMLNRVVGHSESPTRMSIRSGPFALTIDEPEAMGGSNQGPNPMQVLLMSLAGCLNITGHEVARQHGLQLNRLNVDIQGELNPCKFMGISNDERAGFQDIQMRLEPDFESITSEQYEAWVNETESRCPVTDTLKAGTRLRVSIAA